MDGFFAVLLLLFVMVPLIVSPIVIYTAESPITKYAKLYQNNVTLNLDGSISIDTFIIWDRVDLSDDEGYKNNAYSNHGSSTIYIK